MWNMMGSIIWHHLSRSHNTGAPPGAPWDPHSPGTVRGRDSRTRPTSPMATSAAHPTEFPNSASQVHRPSRGRAAPHTTCQGIIDGRALSPSPYVSTHLFLFSVSFCVFHFVFMFTFVVLFLFLVFCLFPWLLCWCCSFVFSMLLFPFPGWLKDPCVVC